MSALGHKRTFAPQKVMSALPPKADMQFKPDFPDFWESLEAWGRPSSTRPLIASSSDASAERDVGHQAFQLSRIRLRDGRGIPYTGAIHTQDRSTWSRDCHCQLAW